eukprot:Nk52_evm46s2391 gene=Nk52_evmTU46s2391
MGLPSPMIGEKVSVIDLTVVPKKRLKGVLEKISQASRIYLGSLKTTPTKGPSESNCGNGLRNEFTLLHSAGGDCSRSSPMLGSCSSERCFLLVIYIGESERNEYSGEGLTLYTLPLYCPLYSNEKYCQTSSKASLILYDLFSSSAQKIAYGFHDIIVVVCRYLNNDESKESLLNVLCCDVNDKENSQTAPILRVNWGRLFNNCIDAKILQWGLYPYEEPAPYMHTLQKCYAKIYEKAVIYKRIDKLVFEGKRIMRNIGDEDVMDVCTEVRTLPLFHSKAYGLLLKLNSVFWSNADRKLSQCMVVTCLMECNGFGELSLESLLSFENIINLYLKEINDQVKSLGFSHSVLLTSPKEVTSIIFDTLELDKRFGHKPGLKSHCSEEKVLEHYSQFHVFPSLVLKHRKAHKLLTSFINPCITRARESKFNSRLYPKWSSVRTSTGRIISYEPNMQNFPKHSLEIISSNQQSMRVNIREAFKSPKGSLFVTVDYRQIELRFAAHFSQDQVLLSVLHAYDDMEIFKGLYSYWEDFLPQEIVQLENPYSAVKRIFYAVLYGVGKCTLATIMSISTLQAKEVIDGISRVHSGLTKYISDVVNRYRTCGYTVTHGGRRKYQISYGDKRRNATDDWLTGECFESHQERSFINFAIQGSVAEIMSSCMVSFMEKGWVASKQCKLVLYIHDEFVFEVDHSNSSEAEYIINGITQIMENIAQLTVPLKVAVSAGESWGTLKTIVKNAKQVAMRPLVEMMNA